MEKKKVEEVYRRYLKSLNDQNANIADNLASLSQWLSTHTTEPLKCDIKVDAVYQAMKAIDRRRISCKTEAGMSWDKSAVERCYNLLNNLDQALKEDDTPRAKVISTTFWKHVNKYEFDMPWLYLYMHIAYSRTFAGSWMGRNREMALEHDQLMKRLEQDDNRLTVQSKIVESTKPKV